jgi:hypothetical protein
MNCWNPRRALTLVLLGTLCVLPAAAQETPTAPRDAHPVQNTDEASGTETIVFFRHGEKPAKGLGQLTPQGLNRALALAKVLPEKFGKPDYLFAPDPASRVKDAGGTFYYVRPLATIEPLAISLGMPVLTPFGFPQVDKLNAELTKPQYSHALIFVAWEHGFEAKGVTDLVKQFGGNSADVPPWHGSDYDSLYVVKLIHKPNQPTEAKFTLEHEGLNNLSKSMPTPAEH